MAIKPASLKALNVGWNTRFQSAFSETPTFYERIATKFVSNHGTEVYAWLDSLPSFREWIGPRQMSDLKAREYLLRNKKFEMSVRVKREDIDDDSTGTYGPLFSEMGVSAKKLPDEQVAAALIAGTSALGFDGLSFFNAAHTLNPAATQSNTFTATALTADNLNAVQVAMASFRDVNGRTMGVKGNLLVYPPALRKTAREIVSASTLANGADNVMQGTVELLEIAELQSQPTVWYVMDNTRAIKPLIWQERQAPVIESFDSPSDYSVFKDGVYDYGADARGVAGYGPWFLAARCIA